jgi:PAS domain S-box-containing protein
MLPEDAQALPAHLLGPVLDSISDGVVIVERGGTIVLANRAMEEMAGWSREELVGQPVEVLVPSGFRADHVALRTAFVERPHALRGGQRLEMAVQRRDGGDVPVQVTLTPMETDGGLLVSASVQDITESKMTRRELAAERERLQSILDASPVGVAITVDGIVRFSNPRATELAGIETGKPIGTVYADEADRTYVLQEVERHGVLRDHELRVRGPDGDARDLLITFLRTDYDGEPGILGWMVDVGEMKEAERAVRESEERLSLALEGGTLGLWDWFAASGKLVTNDIWSTMLGYDRAELDRRYGDTFERWEALVHPEDLSAVYEALEAHFDDETSLYRSEHRMRTAEGAWKWILDVGKAVERDAEGKPVRVIGIHMDIDEERQLREGLEAAKRAAEAASDAKSNFLANMSHEIRTPLNAILGFSQVMARDAGLPPEHRPNVDTILKSGEHLMGLLNDVLEMSKIEAGRSTLRRDSFDLRLLLDELEVTFRVRTGAKRLDLVFEVDDAVPGLVLADERKLRQILINLLGNAVKFTEEGTIALRAGAGPAARSEATTLEIDVEDTGRGIAQDELEMVFSAFEQSEAGRNSKGGTGLGLPISREFARMMGGDLTVTSEVGRGSTFHLTVELEEGDERRTAPRELRRKVVGLAPGEPVYRILLVDDEEKNRAFLSALLRDVGVEVREAEDGREGLEIFEAWRPDCVFMDLKMPVMDGHEAIRRIKEKPEWAHTPVIAITASVFTGDQSKVLAWGADGFVGKPFTEGELFATLEHVMGMRFEYEDVEEAVGEGRGLGHGAGAAGTTGPALTGRSLEEALAALPAEELDRLREASDRLDLYAILDLAEQIGERDAGLAARLKELADNFDFDGLTDLLGSGA